MASPHKCSNNYMIAVVGGKIVFKGGRLSESLSLSMSCMVHVCFTKMWLVPVVTTPKTNPWIHVVALAKHTQDMSTTKKGLLPGLLSTHTKCPSLCSPHCNPQHLFLIHSLFMRSDSIEKVGCALCFALLRHRRCVQIPLSQPKIRQIVWKWQRSKASS